MPEKHATRPPSRRVRRPDSTRAAFAAATRDAVIITDATGTVGFANAACEAMLGYEPGGLAGLDVAAIVPMRMRSQHGAGMAAMVASGRSKLAGKSVEVTALRRDGSEVPVELSLCSWGQGRRMGIGATLRDISERRRRDARLRSLAHKDPRTGLPNRVRLADEIDALLGGGARAALLAVSLDGLRAVADGFGSITGDALLEAMIVRLTGLLPEGAMLARLGEDELAILLRADAEEAGALRVADLVGEALGRSFAVEGHCLHVAARIGAALLPRDGTEASEVLASADLALDAARAGPRRPGMRAVRLYEPAMRDASARRRALQDALLGALERHEIVLHYQPQVDLASGRLCGAEALIRWQHPERGLLPPAAFLPAIASSTLAIRFGQWTIGEACRQAAAWRAAGLPEVGIAVNLFAAQIRAGTLAEVVEQALARHRLAPEALELEITEVIALEDDADTLGPLRRLHAQGVRIALDDFGTGYASLSTLKAFPFTKLKIDRGFVRDILRDAHDATIVKAVLDIGRSLGIPVIAEGIEAPEQEAALRAMGCRYGQGYRYGRALAPDAFGDLLAALRREPATRSA